MNIEELDSNLDVSALFRLVAAEKGAAFLDSSSHGYELGRFSILACHPVKTLTVKSDGAFLEENGLETRLEGDALESLRDELTRHRIDNDSPMPFLGGAIGYFSYDYWGCLEARASSPAESFSSPIMRFGFYDMAFVVDHSANRLYHVGSETYSNYEVRRNDMIGIAKLSPPGHARVESFSAERSRSNFSEKDFLATVERIREYIRDGEVYQVNLSQCFTSSFSGSSASLYEALRKANPAPYSAYLDFADEQILSSSPERFLYLRNSHVETRPIKGTRPRGSNKDEELRNSDSLRASAKDRAELLMIVDLERNDLGKVCRPGSVQVNSLFEIETYARVIHQTARVQGQLAEGYDAVDCLKALFPGGSITGAPKIRAMEVIDELEPSSRGIYTGSIGYFGFDGDADFNIAIRTMRVANGSLSFHAGGGIVWDSVPESEYEETLHKASALFEAIGIGDYE